MTKDHENWKWWSGDNDENFQCGPSDTREEAIEEARYGGYADDEGGVHVVEARSRDLRISKFVAPNDLISRIDEEYGENQVLAEDDDGPWFECSDAQLKELIDALRRVADEWQDRHKLQFGGQTFTASRNAEYVPAERKEGGAA